MPSEDLAAVDAGAAHVIFGSGSGLSPSGAQFWTQDGSGGQDIEEEPQAGDQFGAGLAWGDFNGDGFADLAIAVPREDVVRTVDSGTTTITDAGAVNVLYGRPSVGLTTVGNQLWHQDSLSIRDAAEPGDRFGSAVH